MSSGGSCRGHGAPSASDCRKFAPNIFNKSKCSSCFKQKDEHSAEALESNRATRKISKCGYLFVAPGWDFSNPLNRTKRWQRRWFVLYDDGELTYSVDEHPETVPQARVDMTRVLEVAAAEDVTGHPHSLAITSPEGVTFVKGTCREETRWWADVLQVYSRNKGRHKRNATFPGGQTTILQITPTIRSNTPSPSRPRFNSCRSEPRNTGSAWNSKAVEELCNSVFPNGNSVVTANENNLNISMSNGNLRDSCSQAAKDLSRKDCRASSLINISQLDNKNASSYVMAPVCTSSPNINNSTLTIGCTTTGVTITTTTSATTTPKMNSLNLLSSLSNHTNNLEKPPIGKNLNCSENSRSYKDHPASSASPPTRDKHRAEDKARRRILNQLQTHQSERIISTSLNSVDKLDEDACRRILLEHEREREGKLRDIAASLTQPRARRTKLRVSEPTRDVVDTSATVHQDKLVRGDPDGCGLDICGSRYSPTSELRVDLPAEDLLNIKKGWLMKQNSNKEWNKHWFVLRGCGLMFYRDSTAEEKGIMDGVIDLNTVTAVTPVQVARNYGFQTVTWDDRGSTVLSAVTAGIRSSWMSAIRRAANLPDPPTTLDLVGVCPDVSQPQQQQESHAQSPTTYVTPPSSPGALANASSPSSPHTRFVTRASVVGCRSPGVERERTASTTTVATTPSGRSILFSSDEEYRTASEGGRRESGDWSEVPATPPPSQQLQDCSKGGVPGAVVASKQDWSELPCAPPSPPLTRTALSRVKARSRSSSRSRVYKRSNRGSPPSSRHSTLDSVKSEDLVMACCELDQANDDRQQQQHLRPDLLESQLTRVQEGQKQEVQQQSSLLVMIEHQRHEIEGLKSQLGAARAEAGAAETELARLRQQRTEAEIKEKQLGQLVSAMQRSESQRARDNELLESKLLETEAVLRENAERCQMLTDQLESSHGAVERYQAQVNALSDKLSQGIEENERLYNRVRDLEGKSSLSSARERGRSFDSLSDLTNIDLDLDLHALDKERVMEEYDELRSRFEKAVLEIRAMRKELREAHTIQDALELEIFAHKQEAVRGQESNQAQVQLMAARIQDLTNKLALSEKQVRTLKQKCTKVETRDKRRSLSLKGRESFQISQEVEDKLMDLENKISAIEQGKVTKSLTDNDTQKGVPKELKKERKRETRSLERSRLRRKSLDSATSSEPMKVLIRLSALETKVASVTECMLSDVEKDSSEGSEVSESSTNQISLEILMRLRKFEKAVAKSKRRLDKFLGSKQGDEKAEKCLRSVNEILDSCLECKKNQESAQFTETVQVAVSKLEVIFRNKIYELIKRRQQLAQAGQLDERERLKLIAERITFEFVILRQIRCLLEGAPDKGTVLNELVETSQLISNLKFKINGTTSKTYQNISYVQYLTRVLANKLVFLGSIPKPIKNTTNSPGAQIEGLSCLLQKQNEIDEIIRAYKDEKLRHLMKIPPRYLGLERTQKSHAIHDQSIDNSLVQEAWFAARETLNKELAQVEVSHFILRCGQIFEQNISSVEDSYIDFTSSQNIDLETWADKAQDILRQEMELTAHELSNAHKGFSNVCNDKENRKTSQRDHRQLLSDYATIIAQKALIDARISLLQERMENDSVTVGKNFVSNLIQDESITSSVDGNDILDYDMSYDVENVYIHEPASKSYEEKMKADQEMKKQIKSIAQILTCMVADFENLKQCMKDRMKDDLNDFDWPKISGLVTGLASAYQRSSEIREQIKYLTNCVNRMICKQCEMSQKKLTWLSSEHSTELERIRKNQEKEIADIKSIWEGERKSLMTHYEHEAANLRDKIRKLEQRLTAIDSEHSAHVNELRAAYQKSVNTDLDTDAETRKRFKEEIKQLRALCEKGLLAMENSHRRIIAELEEKHRQELESLRIEKEQALSEETQATLAALDAMRKAHEHEVQKEITKFKQEFIRKVQAREDIGIFHKEHEEELEGIKQEILSLSAKYSSKCVESAALEEKVTSLTKQVAQAQQHIMQLDVRNRQLRAHLSIETNDTSSKDKFQIVTGRDSDLLQQREEIHRMQHQYKQEEAFQTPMILPDPSAPMNHSPVYKSLGNCGKHESLTKVDSVNEALLNVNSKNLKSQLDKSLSTEKLKSSFTYQLRKVKPVSLPYSSNLFVSENHLEERKKD